TKGELGRNTKYFRGHVLAAYRVGATDPVLLGESYEMAQWAERTSAAAALSQMAARQAKGEGALASLVRELQDVEAKLLAADAHLSAALGRGDAGQTEGVRRQIDGLETRWKAIDDRLSNEFKEYAALANPKPLSIAATQAQLRADEVLLMFLDT